MSLESINHLAELTGRGPETIRKAAGDLGLEPIMRGTAKLYESKRILPHIYGRNVDADGKPVAATDFHEQKTRLTMRQAEKVELEIAQKAGELVDVGAVVDFVSGMIINCKIRLLAIPVRLGPQAAILDDPNEIADLARGMVNEALEELHDYDGTAGRD